MPERVELEEAQGIIRSGYQQMPHAAYLFFQIRNEQAGNDWIRRVLPDIRSAAEWPADQAGAKQKPTTALNIALSYKGFEALGLPQKALETFPIEFSQDIATRSAILGDTGESAPENWEIGGPANKEIHGVLMMYADSLHHLQSLISSQRKRLEDTQGGLVEVSLEQGFREPDGKEHFGFHDGISQPSIEGVRIASDMQPAVPPGEFLLGYLNQYGLYAEGPAVPDRADPKDILPSFPDGALPGFKDFGRNGSYMVYRKLKQDVAGFWQFIEASAHGDPEAMILLAAKFVGRWPSGAPLTLTPDYDSQALANENKFVYMDLDPEGYRCPMGSHIRRANPRDSRVNDTPEQSAQTSGRHRLIRRAISYGPPLFDRVALDQGVPPMGLEDDGKPRGLHFFGINASITRQFEFLQQTWCNNPSFDAQFETSDPIIGTNNGTTVMTLQARPIRKRIGNVPRFVSVSGGEYLFLPSVSALRYLAKDGA